MLTHHFCIQHFTAISLKNENNRFLYVSTESLIDLVEIEYDTSTSLILSQRKTEMLNFYICTDEY